MLERCFVEVDFCSAAGSNDILACCFCNTIGELTCVAVVGRQMDEYNVVDHREVVCKQRREACFIGHVGLDGTCIPLVVDASALYVVLIRRCSRRAAPGWRECTGCGVWRPPDVSPPRRSGSARSRSCRPESALRSAGSGGSCRRRRIVESCMAPTAGSWRRPSAGTGCCRI